MKNVLFLSNLEVPYRVRFFNELAKHCRLTVFYETRTSRHRNPAWAKSEEKQFRVCYPGSGKSLREKYDVIILGCYHTPLQILAGLTMRLLKIPFVINLDGAPYLQGKGLKARCKRFLLSGAAQYLAAGEKAAAEVKKIAGNKPVYAYGFSSLSEEELRLHRKAAPVERSNTILVVGQYFPYKGMEMALEVARRDLGQPYRFVGMGRRTRKFIRENRIPANVEIIPFLQKQELEREYRSCAMLVLPSRRECWGLVVNEAASWGTPIVSTRGSGAAVELLLDEYPQYLAKPGDPEDLLRCIHRLLDSQTTEAYQAYLLHKSASYSIERSVREHLPLLEEGRGPDGLCDRSRL